MLVKLNSRKKQQGLTAVETTVALLIGAIAVLGALKLIPNLYFGVKKSELRSEVSEIITAVGTWKGMKPNYSTLTGMTLLCSSTRNMLDDGICDSSGGGAGLAPWGGDYTAVGGTTTGGTANWTLTISLIPSDRLDEIMDELAPLTEDNCTNATGCSSISYSGTTITMSM